MEDRSILFQQYKPGGKISMVRFLPLLMFSVLVSIIMAVVLLFLEANFYYIFFTPFLVSLPVFGVLFLLIHFGRCRNSIVGALAGLILTMIYYAGYWELSYLGNVVVQEDEFVEYVRMKGGAPGLFGYFRFRCRTVSLTDDATGSQDEYKSPTTVDVVFNYAFYSIEFFGLILGGFFLGRFLSKRVFFETFKKWASSMTFRFRPDKIPEIAKAVEENDWASLVQISRLPKMTMSNNKTPVLEFKIEYLKKFPGAPLYVSLRGTNMSRVPEAREFAVKGFKGLHTYFIRQRLIAPQSAAILSLHFPELRIPPSSLLPEADSVSKGEGFPEPGIQGFRRTLEPQFAFPSQNIPASGKFDLTSAGISGSDFREKAVAISSHIRNKAGSFVNLLDINQSLCLPVEEEEVIVAKPLLVRFGITMALSIVISLALGLSLMGIGEKVKTGNLGVVMMILGFLFIILVLVIIFSMHSLLKSHVRRRLFQRHDPLFVSHPGSKIVLLQLDNSSMYHQSSKPSDDICLCLLDEPNQRLLLEGFNHRYVVRKENVTGIHSIDIGHNPAVEVCCRMGGEDLAFVLHKGFSVGYISTTLFLNPMLVRNPSLQLYKQISRALGMGDMK